MLVVLPSPVVYFNHVLRLGLFVVTWVSLGYWLYADSAARRSSLPGVWSLSVLFWPIGVYYFVSVRRSNDREHPPTGLERLALMLAVSSIVAIVVGPLATPPDLVPNGTGSILLFGLLVPITSYLIFGRQNRPSLTGA
jgi:hypothetical protein